MAKTKENPKPEKAKTPTKTFSEKELREKIKEHSTLLEKLSTEGRRIQESRQALGNQLNQIVTQSRQLVGAIAALQDLLGEKNKGNS